MNTKYATQPSDSWVETSLIWIEYNLTNNICFQSWLSLSWVNCGIGIEIHVVNNYSIHVIGCDVTNHSQHIMQKRI